MSQASSLTSTIGSDEEIGLGASTLPLKEVKSKEDERVNSICSDEVHVEGMYWALGEGYVYCIDDE